MSQHNFTNRFVSASSLSNISLGSGNSTTSTTGAGGSAGNRRSSFYANSAMMANNSSVVMGSGNNNTSSFSSKGLSNTSIGQQQGSSLFSHANRRESFGAPGARFTTNSGGLGVSQLIHTTPSSSGVPGLMSGNLNSSITSTVSSGSSSVLDRTSSVMGSSLNNTLNNSSSNSSNNNRNSLSGSFSQQNRKRATQPMLSSRSNTFHNIIGGGSQMDDVLSPEETFKPNPLDEALVRENAELKKENEEMKKQLQKLKGQLVDKEKEMVDKDDQLKKAQFASRELTDCKRFIETMSLKLIELGVDPNTLKQHPSSTLSYDLSNILLGSSLELDDSVRELENVLLKYSPIYSRTSTLMQMED